MIFECTDCRHCADFMYGFRVFCLHPELPPEEVCNYHPVGNKDAEDCKGFDDNDYSKWFSQTALGEAEAYSAERYGEVEYQGIRDWCNDTLAKRRS